MRTAVFLCLAASIIAAPLLPQGMVPPPQLSTFAPAKAFDALAWGATSGSGAGQIHLVPHPTMPGKFLVAMTLTALTGGKGSYDLVTGIYDGNTGTGTPDNPNLAVDLNTTGKEFGMTLYHDGLLAVYESFGKPGATGNEVWVAERTSITAKWKDKGKVANIPTANSQTYWDPALANIGGKLHLLYMLNRNATQADIAAAPLDLTKMTIDRSKEMILVQTTTSAADANSPTPIVDSTGELIGLSHHDQQNRNDHYMSFDLDPNTPALMFITDVEWINNGGYAAGTFFEAKTSGSVYPSNAINAMETTWWTGGRGPVGGKMEISVYAPIRAKTMPPFISVVFLSRGFLNAPIPISGIQGKFGLNPGLVLVLASGIPHNIFTGKGTLTLTIPNDPALKGLALPAQSLTVNPKGASGPEYSFGNTAALTIL